MLAPFRILWTVAFAANLPKFSATRPVCFLLKIFGTKGINNLARYFRVIFLNFELLISKQKTVRMTKSVFPILFTRIISPTCRKGKLYLPKHANLVLRKDVTSGHPQHVLKRKIRIGQWSNTVLQYWHQIKVLGET